MVTLSSLCLSVCLSIYLYIYLPIYLLTHPPIAPFYQSIFYLSIYHSPILLSSHSFTYLSIWVQHLIGQQSSANRNILEG